ncbi:hypothetical protein [Candidatus Methanomassiliicoccus intestinalis]|uniref:hypothetical protein n=1 Tax=Candidatus Methanomassiliicoccus intestinalis TaxID=1406512 RepID=UPI0037DDC4E7
MSNEVWISESSQDIELENSSIEELKKLLSKPAGHGDIVIKISVEFCGKEKGDE